MNASSTRRSHSRALLSLALLTALSLAAASLAPPAVAGGLKDFFKKDKGSSSSDGKSSSSSSDRDRASDRDSDGGGLVDLFKKRPERRDPAPSDTPAARPAPRAEFRPRPDRERRGGLLDIFRKGSPSAPAPRPGPVPGYGTTRPPYKSDGSGGLVDIFRKPGRPPSRPVVVTVPQVVIHHYHDPWYYPYDRVFFTHYCPWVVREREVWFNTDPYVYDGPSFYSYERSARQALEDIERGWQHGDYAEIARYVDPDGTIRMYHDGDYSHSMSAREFRALTYQSFEDIQTLRFRFYRPVIRSREVRADAEHLFIGPDGEERRVELTYTLQRPRDRWYIRAIDMREQRRVASYAPPAAEVPAFSWISYQAEVVPAAEPVLALAPLGADARSLTEPEPSRPRLALAPPELAVATSDAPVFVVAAAAGPAKTMAPAVIRAKPWRVVCTSTPIAVAALQSAKTPISAAKLAYQRPPAEANYEIRLSMEKDALSWQVFHRGETRVVDSGTVALPADRAKAAQKGEVCVVVDRLSTPAAAGSLPLFERKPWDLRVGLTVSPKATPKPKPVRSEIVIRPPAE
ncbi:MAG: hypothetical protein HY321_22535 [Armatimonadetes bacterium]|nr:hypothetical protein [Armatimonadota bacterium]